MEIIVTKIDPDDETRITFNDEEVIASIDLEEEEQIVKDGYKLYIE